MNCFSGGRVEVKRALCPLGRSRHTQNHVHHSCVPVAVCERPINKMLRRIQALGLRMVPGAESRTLHNRLKANANFQCGKPRSQQKGQQHIIFFEHSRRVSNLYRPRLTTFTCRPSIPMGLHRRNVADKCILCRSFEDYRPNRRPGDRPLKF